MITGAFMVPHPPLIIPEVGREKNEKYRIRLTLIMKWGLRLDSLNQKRSS